MVQSTEFGMRNRRNNSRGALRSRTSDVIEDFSTLRKDVGRLATAANKAARIEMRATAHRLQQLGRDLRERANDGASYMGRQVREHPATAIGVSLGAGLLIGLLMARR